MRREIVARLQKELEGSRTAEAHPRKACTLLAHRGYARYLRKTEKGGPEIDWGRIETDHAAIFRVKRLKDSERQIWNSCGLEPPPKTLQVTT